MLPDVAAIDKEFDYLVPEALVDHVRVGTMVRVSLHGRRVGGWVVADGVEPIAGMALRPLAKVTGGGPAADLIDLAGWAAWRWAGRRATLLTTASPDHAVPTLPKPALRPVAPGDDDQYGLAEDAFAKAGQRAVLRLPPADDVLPVVLAALRRGPTLVVTPSAIAAEDLAERLAAQGIAVAVVPQGWAEAAAGTSVVVGARAAAWAPCPGMAAVVVIDGHDEGMQQEQAPTWNAWEVAAERARRCRVPCVVVSPCPPVGLLAWPGAALVTPSRAAERAGWAALEVIDGRRADPHTGLYSPRLVGLLRGGGRIVCVLNRKGRARLLACAACRELARCERCGAAVSLVGSEASAAPTVGLDQLCCPRCAAIRPVVCQACGATRLKLLRVGVSRAREELEALAGQPVGQVTAETGPMPDAQIVVGTEAVLHRQREADGVAFLDFDQELLAPRYRAAEEALALLARASRLVGGRRRHGRVLVQTRVPQHDVLVAALTADPGRLATSELAVRDALRFPPAAAVALISGQAAEPYVGALTGVEVHGPDRGRWLVRAVDHDVLSAALAAVRRPPGRLRIAVDPLRL